MVSSKGTDSGLLQRRIMGRTARPGSRRGVLLMGGWSTGIDYWAEDQTSPGAAGYPVANSLAEWDNGMLAVNCAAGLTWGNSAGQADVSTMVSSNETAGYFLPSQKFHLLGTSMGATLALNWAKANPTRVASMVLVLPCVDIQSIYDRDPFFLARSTISGSYGGRPADADNPADNTGSFTGFPIKIYYSTTDTVNVLSEVLAFGSAVGATMVNMGAIGHTWEGSSFTGDAAAGFFCQNDAALPLPEVVASDPTSVTTTTGTLNGTVDPNGIATNYYYSYWRYGAAAKTTTTSGGSGSSPVARAEALSGLESGRFYQYRLVAYSDVGADFGDEGLLFTDYGTHDCHRPPLVHNAGRSQ